MPAGFAVSRCLCWEIPESGERSFFVFVVICILFLRVLLSIQKYASDPRPPHTRQKYEQESGQSMTPNASKQGKFGSLGAIFLLIFLPFRDGGGARKQPIKQPTGMPTSTMALMGRFPSLMGRFPTLMGRFPDFVQRGRF